MWIWRFLKKNKRIGFVCWGVDQGCDELKHLKEKGIPCSDKIEDFKMQFDVITLFHVFEHLSEPLEWLNKLGNCLDENGRIIIEVPNGNDALLSFYKSEEFADFTYWSAHLFLYTVKGFSILMDQVDDLEISKIEYFQRYPISNHLFWLSQHKPGGHMVWDVFNEQHLVKAYEDVLKKKEMSDTLLFYLRKKSQNSVYE